MARRIAFALLCPIALLGLGLASACTSGPPAESACHSETFGDARLLDCLAQPGKDSVRLVLDDKDGRKLRGLAALRSSRSEGDPPVAFAMNAGMYDDDGKPIGLYIENGKERRGLNRKAGPGNFHMLPNGVFSVEADGWHVRTSDDFAARQGPPVLYATQSGPMLVINGQLHPAFSDDGPSRNIRNAVGIDDQGRAHFVISEEEVSFGLLARYFRDRLKCHNVLYFDGFVSSLWDPASGRLDDGLPLGPLILVEKSGKAVRP